MATNDELHSGSSDRFIESLPLKLTRCPLCRYLLDGLPTRHRCPECGFDYDKRWDVIHQDRRIGFIFLACAVLTAVTTFVTLIAVFPGKRNLGLILILYLLGYTYPAWRAITFLRGRRRNMAILGDEGIHLSRGRESVREIPWTTFDDVTYTRVGGDAGFRKDGHVIDTIEQAFFGSDRKTRQFIAIANKWKQRIAEAGDD